LINKMLLVILKQLFKKPFTNLFPLEHIPDQLSTVIKKAESGELEINPPIPTPENFRGRISYDKDKCIGCRLCIRVCPANAISYVAEEKKIKVHVDRCCFCAQCTEICPVQCLSMSNEFLLASYNRHEQVVAGNNS